MMCVGAGWCGVSKQRPGGHSFTYGLWQQVFNSVWSPTCRGSYRHFCSSALPGYTLGTVSHSLKQTQRCLPGSLQRRTHQGPMGRELQTVLERLQWKVCVQLLWKGMVLLKETWFTHGEERDLSPPLLAFRNNEHIFLVRWFHLRKQDRAFIRVSCHKLNDKHSSCYFIQEIITATLRVWRHLSVFSKWDGCTPQGLRATRMLLISSELLLFLGIVLMEYNVRRSHW